MCHYVFQGSQGFGMGIDCCVQFFSVETVCSFASPEGKGPSTQRYVADMEAKQDFATIFEPLCLEKGENLDL